MIERSRTERMIFAAALERATPEERNRYVLDACGDDRRLLARLRILLAHHERSHGPLDELPAGIDATSLPLEHSEPPTTQIGPYELRDCLGEGGMGKVFLAVQREPVRRRVALKVIKPGMDSRQVIARFNAERQALALMNHANVARVLDAGTTSLGHPYFVMELVDGVPITEFANQQQLTIRERLGLFIEVCRAVQHAHQRGIIHRDIKPSNVLVTHQDGRSVVKVIDFGVAKALDQQLTEGSLCTSLGQLIGTPMYMSPEQVDLSRSDIDIRSDVYSLGVLLYELLTGTTPFDKEQVRRAAFDDLRRMICEQDPVRPSARLTARPHDAETQPAVQSRTQRHEIRQRLRGDLDWVVMKALEKDRERRYENVVELIKDLERHLNHEAVHARPPSKTYLARKFARRYRGPLISFLLVMISLVAGFGVAIFQWSEAERARKRAEYGKQIAWDEKQAAEESKRAKEEAIRQRETIGYATDVRLAAKAIEQGASRRAVELLARHIPQDGSDDLRGLEWYYLMQLTKSQSSELEVSDQPLYTLALTQDKTIAAVSGADGVIRFVDLQRFEVVREVETDQVEVNTVHFSPDEELLLSAGDDGTIVIWDWRQARKEQVIRFGSEKCYSVRMTPDQESIVACGETSQVRVFDRAGQLRRTLDHHKRSVEALALSPDGHLLACVSSDKYYSFWKLPNWNMVWSHSPFSDRLNVTDISHNGRLAVYGCLDGTIDVLRLDDWAGGNTRTAGKVQSVRFAPDDRRVAVGFRDGSVGIFDVEKMLQGAGKQALTESYTNDLGRVYAVDWFDEQTVICAGAEGQLVLLPIGQRSPQIEYQYFPALWAVAEAGRSQLCVVKSDEIIKTSQSGHTHSVLATPAELEGWDRAACSPDGRYVLTATPDCLLQFHDLATGTVSGYQLTEISEIGELNLADDSSRAVVVGDASSEALVLDLPLCTPVMTVSCYELEHATLSSDGSLLAVSCGRGIQVYDIDTSNMIRNSKRHHDETVKCLVFERSGQVLFTCGSDRAIKKWEWKANSPPALIGIERHGEPIRIAVSSDGRSLISGTKMGRLTVWNIEAGQRLFELKTPLTELHLRSLSISPAMTSILAIRSDEVVRVNIQRGNSRRWDVRAVGQWNPPQPNGEIQLDCEVLRGTCPASLTWKLYWLTATGKEVDIAGVPCVPGEPTIISPRLIGVPPLGATKVVAEIDADDSYVWNNRVELEWNFAIPNEGTHPNRPSIDAANHKRAAVGQLILKPSQDTTLDGANSGTTFGNATKLLTRQLARSYALIQFDLSQVLGKITKATLRMRWHTSHSVNQGVSAYAFGKPWTERTATWNNINQGKDPLDAAVGDVIDTVESVQIGTDVIGPYAEWDVTSAAQSWQTGALANNGLLLRSAASFAEISFHSRESGSASVSPELVLHTRPVGPDQVAPDEIAFSESRIHAGKRPYSVVAADFNSDGADDLAVANSRSRDISVLLNNGNGIFARQRRFAAGNTPISLTTSDFDGDGIIDLATANYLARHVSLLIGNGDGSFLPCEGIAVGLNASSVTAGDLNEDGVDDLLISNNRSDDVTLMLGVGEGTFGKGRVVCDGLNPNSVAIDDFNGDGVMDVVVTNVVLTLLMGHADGTYAKPLQLQPAQQEIRPGRVLTGDFNADGKRDIVTTCGGEQSVVVWLGNGDGAFSSPQMFGVGADPRSIVQGDFNRDGLTDLATANLASNDISILCGCSDGTFHNDVRIRTGDTPMTITVGDFNQDGVLDLATANVESEDVSVLMGNAVDQSSESLHIKPTSDAMLNPEHRSTED